MDDKGIKELFPKKYFWHFSENITVFEVFFKKKYYINEKFKVLMLEYNQDKFCRILYKNFHLIKVNIKVGQFF